MSQIEVKVGSGIPPAATLGVGGIALDLPAGLMYSSSDGNDIIPIGAQDAGNLDGGAANTVFSVGDIIIDGGNADGN